MRSDGTDVRRLTESPGRDLVGRVSPDGRRIAFNSMRDGSWDVFVMGLDGSNPVNVSRHPSTDIVRSWSRDGLLQFDSDRDPSSDGKRDAYVMREDGSGLRRLTDDAFDNRFLRRGPPGTTSVAFTSDRSGSRGIYLVGRDGRGLRVLYDGPGADSFPSWSPDGRHVAFQSDESGTMRVYVMGSNGDGVRLVSSRGGDRSEPYPGALR